MSPLRGLSYLPSDLAMILSALRALEKSVNGKISNKPRRGAMIITGNDIFDINPEGVL
jgi:hypothetical protein